MPSGLTSGFADLLGALDGRDSGMLNASSTLVAPTVAIGRVKCKGPQNATEDGDTTETEVSIPFGVEFASKPGVAWGFEIAMDSPRVSGRLPQCTAVVLGMTQVVRSGVGVHYLGMRVGVTITGPVGTKVELMWLAVEEAYTGGV